LDQADKHKLASAKLRVYYLCKLQKTSIIYRTAEENVLLKKLREHDNIQSLLITLSLHNIKSFSLFQQHMYLDDF
jgi:hypothetical protein